MSNDIEENICRIFRWQRWDNPQDWGYAYWISPLDADEIPDILMQLEITKKRLIRIYEQSKLIEEGVRLE